MNASAALCSSLYDCLLLVIGSCCFDFVSGMEEGKWRDQGMGGALISNLIILEIIFPKNME